MASPRDMAMIHLCAAIAATTTQSAETVACVAIVAPSNKEWTIRADRMGNTETSWDLAGQKKTDLTSK